MTDAIQRARQVAKNVLAGQYDPLLACREIADIRDQLPAIANEVMDVFVAVASEVDDLPIGPERANWSAESLRVKDLEAANYREQVRAQIGQALQDLLEAIAKESHS